MEKPIPSQSRLGSSKKGGDGPEVSNSSTVEQSRPVMESGPAAERLSAGIRPVEGSTTQAVKAQPISGRPDSKVSRAELVVVEARPIRAATLPEGQPLQTPSALHYFETPEEMEEIRGTWLRRKRLFTAAPSWLVSLLLHLGLILILAAITLDPVQTVISILQASTSPQAVPIEEFDLQAPTLESNQSLEDELLPPSATSESLEMPELSSPLAITAEADLDALETNAITEGIIPSSILQNSALAQLSTSLNSRSAAAKSEMLERFGGTADSERAVGMALKWLSLHQASDGGWNFAHSAICGNKCQEPGDLLIARNGATAMALLPFLGAGQTHVEGQYKQTVKNGLAYLINRMQVTPSGTLPYGSWHEPGGRMYSHGLAAIAVCEAYAMTRDPDLQKPAQLSLNYLVYAQHEAGGWRYSPQQPGDTSVVGWCLMALKSGKMGNLIVPDHTFRAADSFLDFVSTNNGAFYGYNRPTSDVEGRQATIAVGLLCRMYLGYPKEHPGLQAGIQYLSQRGPKTNDLYYSYYATQVLRHHGGRPWDVWNNKLRDELVKSQEQNGHVAGSWAPAGNHSEKGGRLYQTSLAAMILEVYYRHMPLYSERSSADDFEI